MPGTVATLLQMKKPGSRVHYPPNHYATHCLLYKFITRWEPHLRAQDHIANSYHGVLAKHFWSGGVQKYKDKDDVILKCLTFQCTFQS